MSKDDEGDAADVVYMKTSPYDKMVQALRKCQRARTRHRRSESRM
jgi:hypothetical protein